MSRTQEFHNPQAFNTKVTFVKAPYWKLEEIYIFQLLFLP